MLFESLQASLLICILLAVGVVISRLGWINGQTRPLLTKLVVRIAVPCTIFTNTLSAMDKQMLLRNGWMLIISFLVVGVCYAVGLLSGRWVLYLPANRRGAFACMSGCPNTIFIGLPIITALYGDAGVPWAMFFFISTTTLFWSVGNLGLQIDGQAQAKLSVADMLRRIFSVNVIIILCVFGFAFLEIPIPDLITNVTRSIGNLATPLSLFFSGDALYTAYKQYGARGLALNRDISMIFLMRFLISPALTLLLCLLFGVDGQIRTVFILMSAMPVMTQTVILAGNYGGDKDFVAVCFFWTTILSMLILPAYMSVIPLLG